MKRFATLAALTALATIGHGPLAAAPYAPPPREPHPRVRTAFDLSRLEAAAAKRARRALRRRGVA